jgi:hypothetical protein
MDGKCSTSRDPTEKTVDPLLKWIWNEKKALLWRPIGLNSPLLSEFQFYYFMFLRCPSEILRDLIA